MVDPDLRQSLSQDVRRLVTGRMTNDDFDDVYYERYDSSDDRAVREISEFCYCLYSSDLLFPLRLRGRHSLDADTKCTCTRAILFLRSCREYEWPPFPDNIGLRMLSGIAFLGIPAGISLFIVGALVALSGELQFGSLLLFAGIISLVGSTTIYRLLPQSFESEWESFRRSGDYDVWPFRKQADFDDAKQTCHLLANTDSSRRV